MLNIGEGRRDLLIALTGRMVSTFGDGVALVALTLRLQADAAAPYEVAALLAAGVIPQLLLSRQVGRLVDSHDSRQLLVSAGLIEVACTVPLVFLHSVAAIVTLVALLGAAAAVSATTWAALVPRVVGEDHVGAAVSAQQSLNALVLVAAPAVGGLLAGAFGTGVPMAVDAVTFAVVTAAAALVHTRRRPAGLHAGGGSERVQGGFEMLRRDPVLGPLTVGVALVILLAGMVDVVLVFLIRNTLHAGAGWYGAAGAAWMAGMVAGSLLAARLRTEQVRIWATIGGAGVTCGALAVFAVVPAVWPLIPLSIVGGLGNGYAAACFSTLIVSRTPDSARGRVSAAVNALAGGAQGLSLLIGGAAAVALTPRTIYAVGGLLGVAATIAIALIYGVRTTRAAGELRPQAGLVSRS